MHSERTISIKYPNLIFWFCFLLLNFLLFVPYYFFYREDATFWPLSETAVLPLVDRLQMLLVQRPNPDIFRLNFELTFLLVAWIWLKRIRHRWLLRLIFSLYLLQLLYGLYEGFIRSYYLLDPVFYNDLPFFADGTLYVLRTLHLPWVAYVGGTLLIVAVSGLLFFLIWLLLRGISPERLGRNTRLGLTSLLLCMLLLPLRFDVALGMPETAVSSFTAKLIHNLDLSRDARAQVSRFDSALSSDQYAFTQNDLTEKPDIYLIFIESYGSILYQRPDFQLVYTRLLRDLETDFTVADWHIASNRSNAPTWGGGSWIAYTSALTGVRLNSHTEYLAFFNRYEDERFPHLFNYLRDQGYRSYRLSSNANELNSLEWERYKSFYGVDEWYRFSDMGYEGPLYGWGPAPPDQVSLNFAMEAMQADPNPHVFFYITQNSHFPWIPLPNVAEDWRTFYEMPQIPTGPTPTVPHEQLRNQYLQSIVYELTMLTQFIMTEGDENDLFVLVGDHQPSRVARYADGWDTPIHIISQNEALIESFRELGFVAGLDTSELFPRLQHEGIYSALAHVLLSEYGRNPDNVPPYLPAGIPLETAPAP